MRSRVATFLYWFTSLCYGVKCCSISTVQYTLLFCWIPVGTFRTTYTAWIYFTVIRLIFWAELTSFSNIIPYWLISRTKTLSNCRLIYNSRIRLLAIFRIFIVDIGFSTFFNTLINSLIIDKIFRANTYIFSKTKISIIRTIKT